MVHQPHPVGPLGFIHVSGGQKDGQAAPQQAVENLPKLPPGDRVHPKRGLVQEQEAGAVNKGADQAQFLAHPAGEITGQPIRERGEVGKVQQLRPPPVRSPRSTR